MRPSNRKSGASGPVEPKPTRAEKVASNRRALLRAGFEIVGERGYEEASIARIVERAGLAHGTFYKHFDSRQAFFEELLPGIGTDLLDEVREQVRGSTGILEVEERGFRGFFDFVARNPGFYRVLNEAEVAAPAAFDKHIHNLARHYTQALQRSHKAGEMDGYEPRELEVIAFVLMAARFYIYLRFAKSGKRAKPVPQWVVTAYMKFVTRGLLGR